MDYQLKGHKDMLTQKQVAAFLKLSGHQFLIKIWDVRLFASSEVVLPHALLNTGSVWRYTSVNSASNICIEMFFFSRHSSQLDIPYKAQSSAYTDSVFLTVKPNLPEQIMQNSEAA